MKKRDIFNEEERIQEKYISSKQEGWKFME
jgi:hypothetical protein